MAESSPAVTPQPEILDLKNARRRLGELAEICQDEDCEMDCSESDKLVYEFASQIQSKVDQVMSGFSEFEALGDEDLEACKAHLQAELRKFEEEKVKLSSEIRVLSETKFEDLNCLETDVERLTHLLDYIDSKDLEGGNTDGNLDPSEVNLLSSRIPLDDTKFEVMELTDQLEKNNIILRSLQDFDACYRRSEAIDNIEDKLTGVELHDYEKNSLSLTMRTYIPILDGTFHDPKIGDLAESLELDHKLVVKLIDGTLEPEHLEISPNDVQLGEILDAAKAIRHTRPLTWSLRKVQDRIAICALRKYMVKAANNSRHSYEYSDSNEIITAHLVGEIDAFIKVPQGWPLINSPLKLISLRSSDQKKISLTFLCRVQEAANSLDTLKRQNLQRFVEAVEEILVQQMNLKLHHSNTPKR